MNMNIFKSSEEQQFSKQLSSCSEDIKKGRIDDAVDKMKDILGYPGEMVIHNDTRLVRTMEVYRRLAESGDDEELAEMLRVFRKYRQDCVFLYNVAYALVDRDMPSVAATLLWMVVAQEPANTRALTELAYSLEKVFMNEEAARLLLQGEENGKKAVDTSFICRYLLAYNNIMCGNVSNAKNLVPQLKNLSQELSTSETPERDESDTLHVDEPPEEDRQFMIHTIDGMLERADIINSKNLSSLSTNDLRGWHFVINASILFKLSDDLENNGMNGRYASHTDSPDRIMEGIIKLGSIVREFHMPIHRIWHVGDTVSLVLSKALAKYLNMGSDAIEEWNSVNVPEGKGIIVAYDLSRTEDFILESLKQINKEQILWSHLLRWTGGSMVTPDFVTALYQINTPPWPLPLETKANYDNMAQEILDKNPSLPNEKDPEEQENDPVKDSATQNLKLDSLKINHINLSDLKELVSFTKNAITSVSMRHSIPPVNVQGMRLFFRRGNPVHSNRLNVRTPSSPVPNTSFS